MQLLRCVRLLGDVRGERGETDESRHVSFVDCPGHDILMATMLTGAAVSEYLSLWETLHFRTSAAP